MSTHIPIIRYVQTCQSLRLEKSESLSSKEGKVSHFIEDQTLTLTELLSMQRDLPLPSCGTP